MANRKKYRPLHSDGTKWILPSSLILHRSSLFNSLLPCRHKRQVRESQQTVSPFAKNRILHIDLQQTELSYSTEVGNYFVKNQIKSYSDWRISPHTDTSQRWSTRCSVVSRHLPVCHIWFATVQCVTNMFHFLALGANRQNRR